MTLNEILNKNIKLNIFLSFCIHLMTITSYSPVEVSTTYDSVNNNSPLMFVHNNQ